MKRFGQKVLLLIGLSFMPAVGSFSGEPVKLVWNAPGCVYPVLGWRMPVQLADSDWRVDRAVAALDSSTYNCHFYTRLHLVERTQPSQMTRWANRPTDDAITPECLMRYGLRKLDPGEPVRPGDVVVAGRTDSFGSAEYTHSAVVREVDDAGAIKTIRQKFDDAHPVVDVAPEEFRMLYAGMQSYRTEVWGWSLGPRHQVATR